MAYRIVGCECRNLCEAAIVVHAVQISYVFLTTEDVDNRDSDLLELFLLWHRHARNCSGWVHEETAVHDHEGLETWVGAVVEGLETAA